MTHDRPEHLIFSARKCARSEHFWTGKYARVAVGRLACSGFCPGDHTPGAACLLQGGSNRENAWSTAFGVGHIPKKKKKKIKFFFFSGGRHRGASLFRLSAGNNSRRHGRKQVEIAPVCPEIIFVPGVECAGVSGGRSNFWKMLPDLKRCIKAISHGCRCKLASRFRPKYRDHEQMLEPENRGHD
jgi:hypothetical protein